MRIYRGNPIISLEYRRGMAKACLALTAATSQWHLSALHAGRATTEVRKLAEALKKVGPEANSSPA